MEASQGDTSERDAVEIDTSEREALEGTERDSTDEWRIEPARAPATVAELEERIDVALVTAQSAEEAALEIGAASLEAAEQARRAAAIAERAGAAASRAAGEASSAAESAARAREAAAAAAAVEPTGAPRGTADGPAAALGPTGAPRASADGPGAASVGEPTGPPRGVAGAPGAPEPGRFPRAEFTPRPAGSDPRRPDPFEERITAFRLRAEKVMIRLQKLEAGADPGSGPSEVVRLR
jgi:hypothetical protein